MTPKEDALAFVQRMSDDVTIDEVIYKLELYTKVQTGLQQVNRGQFIDHDSLFDELLKDDAQETPDLVAKSKKRSGRTKEGHRQTLAKNGQRISPSAKGIRK